MKKTLLFLLLAVVALSQTDSSSPILLAPQASDPGTCRVGQTYFNTVATAGQNLKGCTSTNVWTTQAGGIQGPPGATGATGAAGPTTVQCPIVVGDHVASTAITNGQLGPQVWLCLIPVNSTLTEIQVAADAGTPNVIVGRHRPGSSVVNLTSSALATGASGALACSKVGGGTSFNGVTTCSSTLQNTTLLAGDYIELVSGTAGGVANLMSINLKIQ